MIRSFLRLLFRLPGRTYWWVVFRDRATGNLSWAYGTPYSNETEARLSAAQCIFLADLAEEEVTVAQFTEGELKALLAGRV